MLWPSIGVDADGEAKVGPAVQVLTRWEQGRGNTSRPHSAEESVTATIIVDRVVPIGSILWKGKINAVPEVIHDLVRVMDYREVPDIKGRNKQRLVLVSAYSDKIPA